MVACKLQTIELQSQQIMRRMRMHAGQMQQVEIEFGVVLQDIDAQCQQALWTVGVLINLFPNIEFRVLGQLFQQIVGTIRITSHIAATQGIGIVHHLDHLCDAQTIHLRGRLELESLEKLFVLVHLLSQGFPQRYGTLDGGLDMLESQLRLAEERRFPCFVDGVLYICARIVAALRNQRVVLFRSELQAILPKIDIQYLAALAGVRKAYIEHVVEASLAQQFRRKRRDVVGGRDDEDRAALLLHPGKEIPEES
ncbi:hypothetical protein D9M72_234360 [compost metagenome]